MSKIARIQMLKAMELIVRSINDERIVDDWLSCGVADGDIRYGDLQVHPMDEENLEYYLDDDDFADLMDLFLNLMKAAKKNGGLYYDGIVSKPREF